MFGFLKRKKPPVPFHPRQEPRYSGKLSARALEEIFRDCGDFDSRRVWLGGDEENPVTLLYIDGVVSSGDVSQQVLRPLSDPLRFPRGLGARESLEKILAGGIYSVTCKLGDSLDQAVEDLVNGFCVLVFDGLKKAVSFEVKTKENRAVSEVSDEKALKGAKDSFVEIIRTNTGLVRKKLRDPALKIREQTVGRKSGTRVAVCYLEGLTDPELVQKVEKRLEEIDIDGVLTTGNLENYLADNARTPFPQLLYTQRPDKFCLNLLEGRVGILADGLPLGFMAPGTLAQFMKVAGDNSLHYLVSSAVTFLRWVALVMTILLPAFYVAVAMYHHEMIPTKLMLSIIASKENVPFSTAIEVLGMLVAFELLQEAGLRLPDPIGETVSIIGALIVGQSAVEAKIVSPVVVVIVAFAGIAGYTMPNQDFAAALRICRFLLVLCAIFGGMFGVVVGIILLVYHLAGLESLGVPYLTPFAGKNGGKGLLKALFRPPLYKTKFREEALHVEDIRNQK